MPRFKNIIPGVTSDAILIYGDIGEWSDVTPRDIVTQIMTAAYTGRKTDARINSNGGEVLGGIAIFNALRDTKAEIEIYIDGVAASMASVIAACGKPVHMGKYSRLMVHRIQGGAWGTPEELKSAMDMCISLEADLIDIYSKRLKITPEEVKATYFDGKDHWLTADEALRLGFVDSIYDTDPIDVNLPPKQVYEYYQNKFKNQFITPEEMNDVKKRLGLPETATEAEVLAKIEEIEAAKTAAETAAAATDKDATITELTNKLNAYKQKEEADNEAAINKLVDDAIVATKITADQKPHFVNILKANRESGEAILNKLQPARRAAHVVNRGQGAEPEGESAWEKRTREIEENAKKR